MTWDGSIGIDAGQVRGALTDPFGWELLLSGTMDGANRMALVATLARPGRDAPAGDVIAARQHAALLKPGASFTGQMLKAGSDIGPRWWTGSLTGPWAMRLRNARWDGGPISLQGEAI